jgi:hypothetical protein
MQEADTVLDRVKRFVAEIAGRPNNVTLSDIEWVANQLVGIFEVRTRPTGHGILFRIDRVQFHVCTHNPGNKQIKRWYVKAFLEAMVDLGLYEE